MEEKAFMEMVETYQKQMTGFCYNIVLDRQLSEDAAQETFIKAWLKRGQYKGKAKYVSWLYAIAAHVCIDILRKRKTLFSLPDNLEAPLPPSSDPKVAEALLSLKPKERAILYLRAAEDYDYQELARIFHIAPATARKRYERAKKHFIEQYHQERMVSDGQRTDCHESI